MDQGPMSRNGVKRYVRDVEKSRNAEEIKGCWKKRKSGKRLRESLEDDQGMLRGWIGRGPGKKGAERSRVPQGMADA